MRRMWNNHPTGLAIYPGPDGPPDSSGSHHTAAEDGAEAATPGRFSHLLSSSAESHRSWLLRGRDSSQQGQDNRSSNPIADSDHDEEEVASSSPQAEETQVRESQLEELDWVDHDERFYESDSSVVILGPPKKGSADVKEEQGEEVLQEVAADETWCPDNHDLMHSADDSSSEGDPVLPSSGKPKSPLGESLEDNAIDPPSPSDDDDHSQILWLDWDLWLPDQARSDTDEPQEPHVDSRGLSYERANPFGGLARIQVYMEETTWARFKLDVINALEADTRFLGAHCIKNQSGRDAIQWQVYIERARGFSKTAQRCIESPEDFTEFAKACFENRGKKIVVKLIQLNPIVTEKQAVKAKQVEKRLAALHGQDTEGDRARQDAKRLRHNKNATVSRECEIAGRLMRQYQTNRTDLGIEGPVYMDPFNRNLGFALNYERAGRWAAAIVGKVPGVSENSPPKTAHFRLQPIAHWGVQRKRSDLTQPSHRGGRDDPQGATPIGSGRRMADQPLSSPTDTVSSVARTHRRLAEPPTPLEHFLIHCHIPPEDAGTRSALAEAGLYHWSGLIGLTAAQIMTDFQLKPGAAYLIVRHCASYEEELAR